MAFNQEQFRELIVDVLREADLYSPAAVELLMLTAAVESNFGTYFKQKGGPALGVFQMEPRTHEDIWRHYLDYKDDLKYEITGWAWNNNNTLREWPDSDNLKSNLAYAIVMARVHYLRVPEPLPNATNVEALAQYWKDHYNTHLGKGTVEKAIEKYKRYCV